MNTRFSLSIPLIALTLLAGCSSQPTAEQEGSGVEDRNPSAVTSGTASGGDPYTEAMLKDPKSPLSKRKIYFDYDSYVVKDEYKALLDHHAKFLTKNGKYKMLVQGNADERGSREYNLALGQKRAEAVVKSLTLLGARGTQLEPVSFGMERPAVQGSDEAAYAKNRRAELKDR
jgi:peptidoglycan-associated lipoprotein